jgi:hypothetical protein
VRDSGRSGIGCADYGPRCSPTTSMSTSTSSWRKGRIGSARPTARPSTTSSGSTRTFRRTESPTSVAHERAFALATIALSARPRYHTGACDRASGVRLHAASATDRSRNTAWTEEEWLHLRWERTTNAHICRQAAPPEGPVAEGRGGPHPGPPGRPHRRSLLIMIVGTNAGHHETVMRSVRAIELGPLGGPAVLGPLTGPLSPSFRRCSHRSRSSSHVMEKMTQHFEASEPGE